MKVESNNCKRDTVRSNNGGLSRDMWIMHSEGHASPEQLSLSR